MVDDGFSTRSKISVSKSGMIKTDKKVRIGSELKQMEKEYFPWFPLYMNVEH